jgi:hypothetical protein
MDEARHQAAGGYERELEDAHALLSSGILDFGA